MGQNSEGGGYWDSIGRSKEEILNVHERVAREQGFLQRAIGKVGRVLASPGFFLGILLFHVGWIVINHPAVSPIEPFDPPPYVLLATLASVEAPLLSLLILMRQQRDRKIAELREETSLQVDLHNERETSAVMTMLTAICRRLDVDPDIDPQHLQAMQEPLDAKHLFEGLRQELQEVEKEEGGEEDGDRRDTST